MVTKKIGGGSLDAREHAVLMGKKAGELMRFHKRNIFHRAHDAADFVQHPQMPLDLRAFAHATATSFTHLATACCHCSRLSPSVKALCATHWARWRRRSGIALVAMLSNRP